MFKKKCFHALLNLIFCFAILTLSDIQANTVAQMRLPTVDEWTIDHPDEKASILTALQNYHETAAFTQTVDEFKAHPQDYIQNRINALESLCEQINLEDPEPPHQILLKRAVLKKEYLLKLPEPLSRYILKDDFFKNERTILMRSFFRFERFDPLHRFGEETDHYLAEWEASTVPNYFIFLETIETNRRHRAFAPFRHYVIYYTEEERAQHEATFKDHKIFVDCKPLDSKDLKNHKKSFLYVLGPDGKLYINEHKLYRLHHSSEFSGKSLLGVGEITVNNGKIELINNSSGHYKPHQKEIFPVLEFLNIHYGDLSEVKLSLICADVSATVTFNAQEYLTTRGNCAAISALDTWTPLHHAIYLQQWDIAQSLLPTYKEALLDPKSCNPWMLVYDAKNPIGYKFLLDAGVDPLPPDTHCNPFMWAARDGDLELFDFLYNSITPTQQYSLFRDDCLFNTAHGKSTEMIEYLIQKGFDFNNITQTSKNIMHFAAASGVDMVKYFENKGFGHLLYAHDINNVTPLLMAAKYGSFDTLEYLLAKGFSLNIVDSLGNTPLHLAIEDANLTNIRWILSRPEAKTFVNRKNKEGLTPLHLATSVLPTSLYKKLLTFVDDVDVKDSKGLSPYGYLAANNLLGKKSMANMIVLLEAGANPHERDNSGITAWQHLVRNSQSRALVHLFVHYKGNLKEFVHIVKQEAKMQNVKLRLN